MKVTICDALGRPVAMPRLTTWLARVAPDRARGAVTIALVSDARIRALNRTYRGKNRATDVLSFPNPQSLIPNHYTDASLGDIVIARGVAKRQARRAHHAELTELRLLALHGLLHLLGYDHERDNGQMRRMERRLLKKGGLAAGLIDRS